MIKQRSMERENQCMTRHPHKQRIACGIIVTCNFQMSLILLDSRLGVTLPTGFVAG